MFRHKFSGIFVTAKIQRWANGQNTACNKNQVQREQVSQYTENDCRQSSTAGGCRTDKSENCTPIFLRKGQHERCVKDRIGSTVQQSTEK